MSIPAPEILTATQKLIIAEILSTERKYAQELEKCAKLIEMLQKEKNTEMLKLCEPLSVLIKNQKTFLQDLELADPNKNSKVTPEVIANLLTANATIFEKYALYAANYDKLSELLNAKQNEKLVEKFFKAQGTRPTDSLITPIQRIPRYVLLVKELTKHTPEDKSKDIQSLKDARRSMKTVAKHINEAVRRGEQELGNQTTDRIQRILTTVSPTKKENKSVRTFTIKNVLDKRKVIVPTETELNTIGMAIKEKFRQPSGGNIKLGVFEKKDNSFIKKGKSQIDVITEEGTFSFEIKRDKENIRIIVDPESVLKSKIELLGTYYEMGNLITQEIKKIISPNSIIQAPRIANESSDLTSYIKRLDVNKPIPEPAIRKEKTAVQRMQERLKDLKHVKNEEGDDADWIDTPAPEKVAAPKAVAQAPVPQEEEPRHPTQKPGDSSQKKEAEEQPSFIQTGVAPSPVTHTLRRKAEEHAQAVVKGVAPTAAAHKLVAHTPTIDTLQKRVSQNPPLMMAEHGVRLKKTPLSEQPKESSERELRKQSSVKELVQAIEDKKPKPKLK